MLGTSLYHVHTSLLQIFIGIHACIVSIFLSYGSSLIVHVFLLHIYSCIPVTWLFSLLIIDSPLLNTVIVYPSGRITHILYRTDIIIVIIFHRYIDTITHDHIYVFFMLYWYMNTPVIIISWILRTHFCHVYAPRLHIFTGIHALLVIFLLCVSTFLLHGLLLHVYSCHPVTWLFPVTSIDILVIDILVTGHEYCWYTMCGTKCHVDLSHGGHL